MTRSASLLTCLLSFAACQRQQSFVEPEPGLERMLEQPRVDPFEASPVFDNGMAMQAPPVGTVPCERTLGDPSFIMGLPGASAAQLPDDLDDAALARGRAHFDTYCAACHGITGDGTSVVAQNMTLRRPPSLHEDRLRELQPGALYQIVRNGYGLMPGYAAQLSTRESWGVVAYLRALQLSQHAELAALPAEIRHEFERSAR